uniref:(California timema) hypothetical protein n=1 Tax=Timema californicum TaxID=61474 RepID=A0A7R9P508_TIMCA|nr:unnamed protein product [Timema californicum]
MTKILSSLPLKYKSFRQDWLSMSENKQTIANLMSRLFDEETFRAHKSILAFSSPVFLAKFYENKEVDCKPVNVVEEQDIDPETFTVILE